MINLKSTSANWWPQPRQVTLLVPALLLVGAHGCAVSAGPQERIPGTSLGAASRLERVVAVVEREVITETDLRLEARVAVALRGGGVAADAAPDDALLHTLRDYVIDQTLIDLQAERSGAPAPSPEAIAAEIARLRASFSTRAAYLNFLQRHQISEERITLICARDLRNDMYLQSRIKTRLTGRTVTPADYNVAVRQWLQELRDTVEVRVIGLDNKLARPTARPSPSIAR